MVEQQIRQDEQDRNTRALSKFVEWSLPFLGHRFIRGYAPEATPTRCNLNPGLAPTQIYIVFWLSVVSLTFVLKTRNKNTLNQIYASTVPVATLQQILSIP
jgi:hypothetical protein